MELKRITWTGRTTRDKPVNGLWCFRNLDTPPTSEYPLRCRATGAVTKNFCVQQPCTNIVSIANSTMFCCDNLIKQCNHLTTHEPLLDAIPSMTTHRVESGIANWSSIGGEQSNGWSRRRINGQDIIAHSQVSFDGATLDESYRLLRKPNNFRILHRWT